MFDSRSTKQVCLQLLPQLLMKAIAWTAILLAGLYWFGPLVGTQVSAATTAEIAAPAEDRELEKTLVSLEKASWEAWKNRDPAFFSNFLSNDHLEIHTGGPVNKETVLSTVATPACVVQSYSVDKFQLLRLNDDAAALVYFARQDTVCGGKPVPSPAWATSVYVRRDGRWLNVFYQQTPVK